MHTSQWSDLPLVLTSEQAAAVLQVNRRTLTNMLDRGTLRGVKIGKEWRVSKAEMMRFVEGNGTKTPPVNASARSEAAATLVDKGGLLVVRAEPLADLTDIVKQEREEMMIKKGIEALMRALGPVETARFLTLPRYRYADYVEWHRQWQETLDPTQFFEQVFGAQPGSAQVGP